MNKKGEKKKVKPKLETQQCKSLECRLQFDGFRRLKTHVMRKNQSSDCYQFYSKHKLLDKLESDSKNEGIFCRKTGFQTLHYSYIETVKNDFTKNIHEKMKIRVNQVKPCNKSAQVENGATTMIFLA